MADKLLKLKILRSAIMIQKYLKGKLVNEEFARRILVTA